MLSPNWTNSTFILIIYVQFAWINPYWSSQTVVLLLQWYINMIICHNIMNSIFEGHTIGFQTFFVWALLLIVHTWNSSPLRSNLLRLQWTCCTIPATSGRLHGSPLVWACQWPSSQPLSSPQLSHNDSLWA